MDVERLAPAKVNLFLHVGALAGDGYHPLCSLVSFADLGDVVRMRRAPAMGFEITGPFAEGLSPLGDNLVTRARDLAMNLIGDDRPPFVLTLDKRLPIASGVGGGSADAAATLGLLREVFGWYWDPEQGEDPLSRVALSLGSDVPMCVAGRPMIAKGRGEALSFPPVFPDLDVVLVNPGVPSPTGAVYGAYDADGAPGGSDCPEWPEAMDTPEAVAAFLETTRNDLEAPAVGLQPVIGETLALLRAQPETLFARMSGSGATCFAICADDRDAADLALRLGDLRRDWWVRPCRLAGFRP